MERDRGGDCAWGLVGWVREGSNVNRGVGLWCWKRTSSEIGGMRISFVVKDMWGFLMANMMVIDSSNGI